MPGSPRRWYIPNYDSTILPVRELLEFPEKVIPTPSQCIPSPREKTALFKGQTGKIRKILRLWWCKRGVLKQDYYEIFLSGGIPLHAPELVGTMLTVLFGISVSRDALIRSMISCTSHIFFSPSNSKNISMYTLLPDRRERTPCSAE